MLWRKVKEEDRMGASCQRRVELKRNGGKYGGAELGTITMCSHKDTSEIENGWHLCS